MKCMGFAVRMMLLSFVAFGVAGVSVAKADPVVGYWKNIDDKDKKPKSVIQVYKEGDKYYGKIVKLFRAAPQELCPKCDKCTDFRKDRPVCGMTILWGLNKTGKDYSGGKILDPNNGKIYGAKIWLDEKDNNKLHVRGYLFVFFRTQNWLRVPAPAKATCTQICSAKKAPAGR